MGPGAAAQAAGPVVTPIGRPVRVAVCPTCGSPLVRLGGRPVAHAEPVTLPGYRVLDRAVARRRGPAIVARLQVDVPLQEISGTGDKRAAELTRLRIPQLVALAKADVATASSLPGVSDRMAEEFIAEAAKSSANAADG